MKWLEELKEEKALHDKQGPWLSNYKKLLLTHGDRFIAMAEMDGRDCKCSGTEWAHPDRPNGPWSNHRFTCPYSEEWKPK